MQWLDTGLQVHHGTVTGRSGSLFDKIKMAVPMHLGTTSGQTVTAPDQFKSNSEIWHEILDMPDDGRRKTVLKKQTRRRYAK
jgi:hypothetical protein